MSESNKLNFLNEKNSDLHGFGQPLHEHIKQFAVFLLYDKIEKRGKKTVNSRRDQKKTKHSLVKCPTFSKYWSLNMWDEPITARRPCMTHNEKINIKKGFKKTPS